MRLTHGCRLWTSGLTAAALVLTLGAASAQADTCGTSWKGASGDWSTAADWTNGVPTSGEVACINAPGTYTVTVSGESEATGPLQLGVGAGSGIQTLEIQGLSSGPGQLNLFGGGTIGATGDLALTVGCSASNCSSARLFAFSGMPLVNQGMIESDQGSDSGTNPREVISPVTNTGTVELSAPLQFISSEFDNDTGGVVTNNGGTSALEMSTKSRFVEAGGTTSPATASPPFPAVVIDDTTNSSPSPALAYTGTGASTIEVREAASLSGNIASNQNLVMAGTPVAGGCPEALATANSAFTNAGTITLTGTCDSGLAVTSGALSNSGALIADATTSGVSREIKGTLTNSGVLLINGGTAFDKSGATLSQTGGVTALAPGAILDTSGSGATFQLQGGTLTGGGQSQAAEAVINGPLSNTGGSVIPGSLASPGLMAVDGTYTQGSAGKLTEVIAGPGGQSGLGSGYSELVSTGNVVLAGTLAIDTVSSPTTGSFYTAVAGNGSRSGQFSQVTGTFQPEGSFPPGWTYGYQTLYGSNYAGLTAAAAAGLRVRTGGPGVGTVTSSPAGISCGGQCDAPFFQSQTVTLTAHPSSGWAFAGWSGGCTGFAATCQVQMSQARTVTATFAHGTTTKLGSSANPSRVGRGVTYTATVSPNPGGGTVRFTSGGATIAGCGSVALSASTGKAKCVVKYHSKGTFKVQAVYSGSASYAHSASPVLSEKITK